MKLIGLTRLRPASTVEDRKDFGATFNASLDAISVGPGQDFIVAHPDVLAERPPRAGECRFCHGPINPEVDYRRESGWAKKRSAGGTNALALREAHNEDWAHARCVERMKRGIAPGQEALA